MSPAPNKRSEVQCLECSDAIEILVFNFYTGLPHTCTVCQRTPVTTLPVPATLLRGEAWQTNIVGCYASHFSSKIHVRIWSHRMAQCTGMQLDSRSAIDLLPPTNCLLFTITRILKVGSILHVVHVHVGVILLTGL